MLDSAGYAELLSKRPFLFHRVWGASDSKLESILSNGLERVESNYDGFWSSRPGHVYMGTRAKALKVKPRADGERPWVLLRIDASRLDRRKLNPDEDYFLTHNFVDDDIARRGEHACRRLGVPWLPSEWMWEWARYLSIPFPSLGEWADAVDLGYKSEQVSYSLARGSVAYGGIVPPDAICPVEYSPGWTERFDVVGSVTTNADPHARG